MVEGKLNYIGKMVFWIGGWKRYRSILVDSNFRRAWWGGQEMRMHRLDLIFQSFFYNCTSEEIFLVSLVLLMS